MAETNYSTLFIELDCLIDTRFAVLASFGLEKLKEAFDFSYYTRRIDQFQGIDNAEYKTRYQNRKKPILKDATGTPLVNMLTEFSKKTLEMIDSTPFHNVPRIIINTYPYVLNDEEKRNLLNSFVEITDESAVVELTFMSKEELTPSYVKKELTILVMYEYYEWLEIHSKNENLKKTTCPNVTMMGPAIYFDKLPTAKDLQIEKEAKVSAFRAMELTAAPLIGLALLPIEQFSMALKLKRHNPT